MGQMSVTNFTMSLVPSPSCRVPPPPHPAPLPHPPPNAVLHHQDSYYGKQLSCSAPHSQSFNQSYARIGKPYYSSKLMPGPKRCKWKMIFFFTSKKIKTSSFLYMGMKLCIHNVFIHIFLHICVPRLAIRRGIR